ncbi:MAG: tetratricopeptide repeat protein, partial [Nitrospinales bacterium]
MDRVLDLSNALRTQGVDCWIDQYEESPSEGWPRWMKKRIEESNFVLVVCTEKYGRRYNDEEAGTGSGATWEGAIITQSLYDTGGKNDKFIPIFFSSSDAGFVPTELRSATYYNLDKEGEHEKLYRCLTGQPKIKVPPLGQIVPLLPLDRKQDFFGRPFSLPYKQNPFFTGREDIISRLHDELFVSEETTPPHPQAISGLGGMGKTQTAIEFANRYRDEYKAVFWIDAESRESLISGFISIARLLNLPQKNDKDPNVVIGAAKYWLENNTDWLLIFDNVDDFLLTGKFIPSAGKGHIIITTTQQATGDLAHKIEIEKMPDEDGVLFLLRRGKIIRYNESIDRTTDEHRTTAREIVQELEGLPLALDQAGAYIEETPCTLKEYLDIFRGQGTELLARRGNLTASHPAPVTTTILISFEKVEALKPEAANLLRLCAFFAPGAIPEEIFIKGSAYSTMQNQLEFYNALQVAGRFSLLKRDPARRVVYIHGLVQKVLQDQMNKPTCRVWAERALAVVNHLFPSQEFENWPSCERLLPQALIVLSRIEEFKLVSKESHHLLHQTGTYLTTRGYLDKAEKFLKQAIVIGKAMLGQDHPDFITNLNGLAVNLTAQGRYREAESLNRDILKIRKKLLGEEHPAVA